MGIADTSLKFTLYQKGNRWCQTSVVSITSVIYSFLFLHLRMASCALPKFSSVAFSCCHECKKNPACSLMWQFQCIYFCSYLWILTKCFLQKSFDLSHNVISNWRSSLHLWSPGILSTWVLCWLKEEWMQSFTVLSSLNWQLSLSTFFYQRTWIMPFSCNPGSYSWQSANMRTAPKTKVKVKTCAGSSELWVTQ